MGCGICDSHHNPHHNTICSLKFFLLWYFCFCFVFLLFLYHGNYRHCYFSYFNYNPIVMTVLSPIYSVLRRPYRLGQWALRLYVFNLYIATHTFSYFEIIFFNHSITNAISTVLVNHSTKSFCDKCDSSIWHRHLNNIYRVSGLNLHYSENIVFY